MHSMIEKLETAEILGIIKYRLLVIFILRQFMTFGSTVRRPSFLLHWDTLNGTRKK